MNDNIEEMIETILTLEKESKKKKLSSFTSSGLTGSIGKIDSDIVNKIINMLEDEYDN